MEPQLSSADFPDFLFNAWQFGKNETSEALKRHGLRNWNVSTFCQAYLKYQLDRHDERIRVNGEKPTQSLAALSVEKILASMESADDLQACAQEIVEALAPTHLCHILRDPRLPYKMLRIIDAHLLASHKDDDGERKLVDVDETILASEQYIRTTNKEHRNNYLVTISDLSSIHKLNRMHGTIELKRKAPPKGGFEFLDGLRLPEIEIMGCDALFRNNFDYVTHNALRGLDWNNVFIAGGMVLATLLHSELKTQEDHVKECDIDLYLYGLTPEEANQKVEEIYKVWGSNEHDRCMRTGEDFQLMIVKNSKTINMIPKYPGRRIQIILKLLASPLDVLLNFDLDACACGYDGSRVLMLPRCARALETGYSIFTMDLIWGHHLGNRRETQEVRVFKYADRGFGLRILPSYVRSLEKRGDLGSNFAADARTYPADDEDDEDAASHAHVSQSTDESKVKASPPRIMEGEPGLKTLKRIAYKAKRFVEKFFFEPNELVKTIRQHREEHEAGMVHLGDMPLDGMVEGDLADDGMTDAEVINDDLAEEDAALEEEDGSTDESSELDGESDKENIRRDGASDETMQTSPLGPEHIMAQSSSRKAEDRPIVRLAALDGRSIHQGLPDFRTGLGVFELLMRHCEAWRLSNAGRVWLDRESFASTVYDAMSEYCGGLPVYSWGPGWPRYNQFEIAVDSHNDEIYRKLRRVIGDRVGIAHYHGSYVNYLTRRIRQIIVGPNLESVMAKQITIPMIIPWDLEMGITNMLKTRYPDIPHEAIDSLLIPVHDAAKYDPQLATVPPLVETAAECGNLRYWLISNNSMWAGQHRALDEVAEILTAVFNWFKLYDKDYTFPRQHFYQPGTDNEQCLYHIAKDFRRRLVLPDASQEVKRGQLLSERETKLFRAWALAPLSRVSRTYDEDEVLMEEFQDKYAAELAGDEGL
ncbi:MAG: hypothetical protein Q9174_005813, partial [Haloplaca sp. 1 TL-2023]